MRFINPKTDYAFKKIFGSDQSQDILISFLNAILYGGNSTIRELEILNPHLGPRIRGFKDTYLDIKATITDGHDQTETVIIEMQILNVEGFQKRILYNAAKTYSNQLAIGDGYTDLQPVIALTIVDFEMFPELDQLISRFVLKERTYLTDYSSIYGIELVFIELPKFQKELPELETLMDKWLYFLKAARKLESIPPSMEAVPEIQKAFAIANQANLNAQEFDELERQEIFIQDQRNSIKKALTQGIEQGKLEAQRAIAQQLLSVLDDEAISRTTGLDLDAIAQLRTDNSLNSSN
ncbi:MAG: Rpn family recombination-promoting nuclease/putative transposase [Cyanophyceae cyanobacterium]